MEFKATSEDGVASSLIFNNTCTTLAHWSNSQHQCDVSCVAGCSNADEMFPSAPLIQAGKVPKLGRIPSLQPFVVASTCGLRGSVCF